MKFKINKQKLLVFAVLFIICMLYIYNHFYKIDVSNYSEIQAGGIYFSPNKEYSIMINMLIPRENKNEYFIMGRLVKTEYLSENHQLISNENSKIIYWKKTESDSVNNSIYVKWFNDKKVQIEDKVLNIKYGRYDYRRDIKKFLSRH